MKDGRLSRPLMPVWQEVRVVDSCPKSCLFLIPSCPSWRSIFHLFNFSLSSSISPIFVTTIPQFLHYLRLFLCYNLDVFCQHYSTFLSHLMPHYWAEKIVSHKPLHHLSLSVKACRISKPGFNHRDLWNWFVKTFSCGSWYLAVNMLLKTGSWNLTNGNTLVLDHQVPKIFCSVFWALNNFYS